ncbi:GIP, partial [Symbiodinium necroappetens]
ALEAITANVLKSMPGGAVAKRDDGASSAKAAKAEAQPKSKAQASQGDLPAAGEPRSTEDSPIAAAAKIQAQLESLESRVLEGGREQALQLIRELESSKLQELTGRLKRVQAQLRAATGVCFEDALDAFVTSGSYGSAVAFSQFVPFLRPLPHSVSSRLVVDLKDVNGWGAIKGLPFNRRCRKRLHQSHAWVLHLGANKVDPSLKQLCQSQGLELVVLDGTSNGLLEPRAWKALSWAAFSGRVLAIVGDAPMRTWGTVQTDASSSVRLRSKMHPWGEPGVPLDPTWPNIFKGELSLALFGLAGGVDEGRRVDSGEGVGRDDRGGKYKYVLVAGLRVPDAALPSPRHNKGATASEQQASEAQAEVFKGPEQDDDAASEASWLRDQLEPTPAVKKVDEGDSSSQEEEDGSQVGWYEAPFVDEAELSGAEAVVEADDELEVEGGAGLDVDPWEDGGGFGEMTDEKFDEALSEMLFSGANKVLRFAVPLKARKGPLILAGLQEIVTECNRLGYPVKVVHTDRAKELMSKATMDWLQSNLIQPSFTQGDDPKSNGLAERLVGWVKARARLHLASSGLGLEQWPSAMAFACAEHRGRLLQTGERLPRFGQKVIFKSKHPTGKSKRPFLRWENAVYLCPTPRTEGGHVLLRAASSAYLVAKNVRCVDEMVDPEAEFGAEQVVEVDPPEPGFDHFQGDSPVAPSRRVTGKRAARSVKLAAEDYAETLLKGMLFSSDHCGRLLQLAFEGVGGGTRREHRGPIGFSVIFGAYSHGGLQGITRASRMYPMVCRYLNEYLRQCSPNQLAANEWSSLMVVVADEVAMHRDVRNEPGSLNHVTQLTTRLMWVEGTSPMLTELVQQDSKGRTAMMVRYARMTGEEWAELCQLEEEEFERRMGRWQRVLGGQDEDPNMNALSASIPHHLFMQTVFRQRNWNRNPEVVVPGADGEPRLLARVMDFADDGPTEESPFPDRMLMFSVHDVIRDVLEMVILRVEARRPPQEEQPQEAFCHKWSAFTTDIKSAFTQTPIPAHAARRYLLRPPRWLVDLGLAEPGEHYSLGMVLYGFKEAPAWWSDHRDAKLRGAKFAGHHLEQAKSDSSVWRIMQGTALKGYLVTYVDDFLIVSERQVAVGLHQWLLDGAGHEDGHYSLDQEAYVDELVRTYQLGETHRAKVVCPKEILMQEAAQVQPFDEGDVKAAQK